MGASNSHASSLCKRSAILDLTWGLGARNPLMIRLNMVSSMPNIWASRFCRMPDLQSCNLRLGYMRNGIDRAAFSLVVCGKQNHDDALDRGAANPGWGPLWGRLSAGACRD